MPIDFPQFPLGPDGTSGTTDIFGTNGVEEELFGTSSITASTQVSTTAEVPSAALPILEFMANIIEPSNAIILQNLLNQIADANRQNAFTNNMVTTFLDIIRQYEEMIVEFNQLDEKRQNIIQKKDTFNVASGVVTTTQAALDTAQANLATASGAYNAQLNNMKVNFPIHTAAYEAAKAARASAQIARDAAYNAYLADPSPANYAAWQAAESALSTAINNENAAQAVVTNDYNQYNAAVNQINLAIDAYNSAANAYNAAVSDYNSKLQDYKNAIADFNNQVSSTNSAREGRGDSSIPGGTIPDIPPINTFAPTFGHIANVTPVYQPPYPSFAATPFFTPPGQTNADPQIATYVPDIPSFSDYIAQFIERQDEQIQMFKELTDMYKSLEPNYTIINGSLGALRFLGKDVPDFINDIGQVSASSASSSLATLIIGLGKPELSRILSEGLISQMVKDIFNAQGATFTSLNAETVLGALGALLLSASFLSSGDAAKLALLFNSSLDISKALVSLLTAVALVNKLVDLIQSGAVANTVLDILQTKPEFGALSPEQQAKIQSTFTAVATITVSLVALALQASLTSDRNLTAQVSSAQFLTQLYGDVGALDFLNSRFDNQALRADIARLLGDDESFQAFVSTNLAFTSTQVGIQLSQTALNNLTNSVVRAAAQGANLKDAIIDQLVKDGITRDQAIRSAGQIEQRFNNSILGLAINVQLPTAPVEEGGVPAPVTVLGIPVDEDLADTVLQLKKARLLQELVSLGVNAKLDDQGNIVIENVGFNLQNIGQILTDNAKVIRDLNNVSFTNSMAASFTEFLDVVLSLDPNTLAQDLLDPGQTFIGVMYEGIRTGWKRGDIDVRA
jgi:hypothetical protein